MTIPGCKHTDRHQITIDVLIGTDDAEVFTRAEWPSLTAIDFTRDMWSATFQCWGQARFVLGGSWESVPAAVAHATLWVDGQPWAKLAISEINISVEDRAVSR